MSDDETRDRELLDVVGRNYNGVVIVLDEPSGIHNALEISVPTAVAAISGWLLVKAPGSYLEALATKLGERHADALPSKLRALRLRSKGKRLSMTFDTITFEISRDEITDAAWLALLALDLTAPELAGAVIVWDPAEQRWTRR